jgi:hypothetical protein
MFFRLNSDTEKLASSRDLDQDIIRLGEQVRRLLDYMQEPRFSEHLVSLTRTVKFVLNLVRNAAMFLEDYSKCNFEGELRTYRLHHPRLISAQKILPIPTRENR